MSTVFLILSFICVTSLHVTLLFKKRGDRRATISEHAALSGKTHHVYILGHILGGLFFLIFAYSFFIVQYASTLLFALSVVGVAAEWLQALISMRAKFKIYHVVFAFIMWSFMMIVGPLSVWLLPLDYSVKKMALFVYGLMLLITVITPFVRRRNLWVIQMVGITLFFVEMFVLSK